MKALLALTLAAGVAALVIAKLRRPTSPPPRPEGSWEPADTTTS